MSTSELTINEPNVWRLTTPGHASWPRSARPGDPQKPRRDVIGQARAAAGAESQFDRARDLVDVLPSGAG